MLTLNSIAKSYTSQLLFDDVTFVINPGERVGLVGRNGHGKTTLLNIILGREHPDAGEVIIPKGYRIAALEQHIHFSAPTVLAEACTALPPHEQDSAWKAEKLLDGLGFDNTARQQPPQHFSGGFQRRINLVKALLAEPNLLVLDEPTNYLDIISIRWFEQFLRKWTGELLVVTHDRRFLDQVTTHIVGLHRHKARKIEGNTTKYYELIAQEEEIYEQTRQKEEKKRKKTEVFISKFRAKARQANLAQSRIKMLEKQERKEALTTINRLAFSFNAAPFEAKTVLAAHNLSFAYHNQAAAERTLFSDFDLTVHRGDRIGIIGKNGKGKSTLLRLLAGELSPKTGTVKAHPECKIAYFGQTHLADLVDERTIYEEILYTDKDCTSQRARDICGMMLFSDHLATKTLSVLSGGEKNRVLLGKILASPANLLLLDEPTSHLDMESCAALADALRSFPGAVVVVTHDETLLSQVATRLVIFKQDRLFAYDGTYAQFLDRIGWEEQEGFATGEGATTPQGNLPHPDRIVSKKEQRRLRALQQQQLKKFKDAVTHCETMINDLESELDGVTQEMIEASQSQDSARITTLSKRNHEILQSLDGWYENLERAMEELEREEKIY